MAEGKSGNGQIKKEQEESNMTFEEIKRGVENLIAYLNDQLGQEEASEIVDALQEALDSGTTLRVGFLGNRGVGKTTLMNRLLGFDLLPTGDFSAITATTTEIIGKAGEKYLTIVSFIELKEWESMLADAKEDLQCIREAEDEEDKDGPAVKELHSKLNGLWNPNNEDDEWTNSLTEGSIKDGFLWETKEPLELIPEAFRFFLVERSKSDSLKKEFDNLEELRDFLVNFTHRVEGAAWPLVRKVSILGPFELLTQNGFSLMDIPGSGDGDIAMAKRYQEGRDRCDCLFYLPSATDKLFTLQTVQECTNKENILCGHFGVIISNFHRIFKSFFKSADPSTIAVDEIKRKMFLKMKYFYFDLRQREQFEKLNFYFLENGSESEKYQHFFEIFVQNLKELAKNENWNVVERCMEHISLALGVGCVQLNEEESEEIQEVFQRCRAALEKSAAEVENKFPKIDVTTLDENAQPIAVGDIHYATLKKWLKDPTKDIPLKIGSGKIFHDLVATERVNALKPVIEAYFKKSLQNTVDILHEENAKNRLFLELEKTLRSRKMKPFANLVGTEVREDIQRKLISARERGELAGLIETGKGCRKKMLVGLDKWYVRERHSFKEMLNRRVRNRAVEQVKWEFTRLMRLFRAELSKNKQKTDKKDQISQLLSSEVNAELLRKWSRKEYFKFPADQQIPTKRRKIEDVKHSESWMLLLEKIQSHDPLLQQPEKLPNAFKRTPMRGKVFLLANKNCKDPTRYKLSKSTDRRQQLRSANAKRLDNLEEKISWISNNCSAFQQLMEKIFEKVNLRRDYFEASLPLFQEIGDLVDKVVGVAFGPCAS